MSIDLAGVDLCATLTPEQKAVRDIDEERFHVGTVSGRPSPGCQWGSRSTGVDWTVQIIEDAASSAWVPGRSRLVVIGGYGAVREPDSAGNIPGSAPFCQLPIDVNDTQTLRVQVAGSVEDGDGGDPAAIDRVCARASDFAGDVLANVRR